MSCNFVFNEKLWTRRNVGDPLPCKEDEWVAVLDGVHELNPLPAKSWDWTNGSFTGWRIVPPPLAVPTHKDHKIHSCFSISNKEELLSIGWFLVALLAKMADFDLLFYFGLFGGIGCLFFAVKLSKGVRLKEDIEWRPIETAPTDGSQDIFIAVIREGKVVQLDFYALQEWDYESWEIPYPYKVWCGAHGTVEEPTHWAPMPRIPVPEGGDAFYKT